MLPLGAIAVAVLLNGAQILLPAPAFVEQGRAWAPARAILQRLGHKVTWEPAQQAMIVQIEGRNVVFVVGTGPAIDGQALSTELPPRRVAGTVYLPLQALRALGLRVMWDSAAKQVLLTAPLALPTPTLAAILADPLTWADQEVTLTGEYLGWDAESFCYATRNGPPVSSGDWVLHNEDGAIYCRPGSPTPPRPHTASLAQVTSPLPAFTPYAALGQRLSVTGVIKLTRQAVPYLQFSQVGRPPGIPGLTCRLVLDRLQHRPGDLVTWRLQLVNPHATRVSLEGVENLLVSVADPTGNISILKQSFGFQTRESGALAPGEEIVLEGAVQLPEAACPGIYIIVGRISDQLGTYRREFEVQAQETGIASKPQGD
ncbi:MAG: copper amine oxidase N-terminal domain-containing protein [Armatimonadota bacterium]